MTDTTTTYSNSSVDMSPETGDRHDKRKEHGETSNSHESHPVLAKSPEPSSNSRSHTGTPTKLPSSDDTNTSKIGEDIIPNAIVIKNIPFAIKKEQLLDIIGEMELPLPYAFNYHFDNGIFRGLAFANFSTPEETAEVIANLNGKEINGRKLKVEYKKMLPLAERERIEREKRERRGQLEEQHRSTSSMSLHSLGVMNQAPLGSVSMTNLNTLTSPMSGDLLGHGSSVAGLSGSSTALFSSFINPSTAGMTSGGSSTNLAMSASSQRSAGLYSAHPQPFTPVNFVSGVPQAQNQQLQSSTNMTERYYAPLPSPTTVPIPPQHLDFNDPETLEIYSQLLLFRERESSYYELAYPLALSATHKRVINVLCSYLDLVEIHDPRFIIIRRKLADQSSGVHSHLFQQRQTQDNQYSVGNPMQATSTGGSVNRSQSYIGMLHAHAATANANANVNVNASVLPSLSAGLNSSCHDLTSLSNQVLTNTPKMASQPLLSGQFQLTPSSQGQLLSRNASSASPPASNTSVGGSGMTSLDQQQHPQTLLRQQAGTPTSRLPSGLLTTHQSLSSSNLLLRNPPIKQMSPTVNNVGLYQSAPFSQRIVSNTHDTAAVAAPTTPSISSVPQALLQQNTNGSTHSNFSVHSFHEDGPLNFLAAGSALNNSNNNNMGSNLNPENTYRLSADTNFNFEQHLTKSLSGLELSDTTVVNTNSGRKPLW